MSGPPIDKTEVRAAGNQALFRDINERLAGMEADGDATELGSWNCECADVTCLQQIELTLEEYEQVRSDPRRFFVIADERHVLPEVEVVVERNDRYWVVEKTGEAGDEAALLAPSDG